MNKTWTFLKPLALVCAAWASLVQVAHAVLPIQHWQQPSGARVHLVEAHNIPMVDVQIDLDAGSRRDPVDRPGLASMAISQLASGVRAQPGGQGPYGKALDENQLGEAWADLGARFRHIGLGRPAEFFFAQPQRYRMAGQGRAAGGPSDGAPGLPAGGLAA